jgi:quinohemoprotein ethanol dehydrogenase
MAGEFTGKLEATPLIVDGVMYLTDPPNDVVAVDARTGRGFWRYRHELPAESFRAAAG